MRKSYAHGDTTQPAHYLFLDEATIKSTGQRVVAYTLHTDPVYRSGDGQFWPELALLSKGGGRVLQRIHLVDDLRAGTDVANEGTKLSIQLAPFLIGHFQLIRVQVQKVRSGNGLHTWGLDQFYSLGADGQLTRALSLEQGWVYGKCGRCCGGGLNLRWWAQDIDGDGAAEIIRRTRGYTRKESKESEEAEEAESDCKDVDVGGANWRAYRLSGGVFVRVPKLPRPLRISRDAVDLGGIWEHERAVSR